jgi:hypothetical protein
MSQGMRKKRKKILRRMTMKRPPVAEWFII